MTNPLMKGLNLAPATGLAGSLNPQARQIVQSAKRMMSMLNSAQNPRAALQQAASQNPMLANALKMCNGRSPEEVVREQCAASGVDPNEVISLFR